MVQPTGLLGPAFHRKLTHLHINTITTPTTTVTSANRTIHDKSSSGPCAAYGGDKSKVSNITTITTIWLMNFVQVVFTPLKMEVSTLDAILAKSTSTSIVLV